MGNQRTLAWIVLTLWSAVLIAFIALFFVVSGPTEWGTDSNIKFMSAVIFGIGYIVFFFVQSKSKKVRKDERDYLIALKSSNATLIVILIYVFLLCISIFVYYEKAGFVPVSWMWFIAYTSVFLTYIINSGIYLWYEKRIGGSGRH